MKIQNMENNLNNNGTPEGKNSTARNGQVTENTCGNAQNAQAAGNTCGNAQDGHAAGNNCGNAQNGLAAGNTCDNAQNAQTAGRNCGNAQNGLAAESGALKYCYKYPHPAVTTDCVIFGFDGTRLKVLLVRRGVEPYKGCWAFPGGFLNMGESAEEGALRELREETGLDWTSGSAATDGTRSNLYTELGLDQPSSRAVADGALHEPHQEPGLDRTSGSAAEDGTRSNLLAEPGLDRTSSAAADGAPHAPHTELGLARPSSTATGAGAPDLTKRYFRQLHTFSEPNRDPRERVITIAYYALVRLQEVRGGDDAADARWFALDEVPALAFDHDLILRTAMTELRRQIHFEPVGFELLPEKFTVRELQNLYEAILDVRFDRRNFYSKMKHLGILTQLDERANPTSKKEAFLFSFNPDKYAELKDKGFRLEF